MKPGDRIGPYDILGLIGAGGMGEVYRARDTRLGRTVAVKILPAGAGGDSDSSALRQAQGRPEQRRGTAGSGSVQAQSRAERRRRFEQEARAASALNDPHICTVYDIGRDGETDYLVLEFIDGETLAARLARGALPVPEAIEYGRQIAGALAGAHAAGIVHRDLKPGNVMLTWSGVAAGGTGRAKLLDFGLAKLKDPALFGAAGASFLPTGAAPMTGPGMVLGTLAYMAPEQLEGKETDARADIFAFGAVLYEMLTGRRAFHGATAASVISAIMTADPPLVSALAPQVALDQIVRKCLAKDPAARWQRAADLAEALRRAAVGTSSAAVLPGVGSAPESARRRWVRPAIAVAALAGLVLAAALGWRFLRPALTPASASPAASRITSLAIKPLDDFSGDGSQGWLSDGMTEALGTALGNIRELSVRGRSSAAKFKGSQTSIREMARELNVDAIVEGSVQRAGNKIMVTVRLIEAATDRQVWSQQFGGDLGDVFRLQSDIAREIAAGVRATVTPEDRARLGRARAAKPATIEAYYRGVAEWWRWSDEGMANALRYFKQATDSEQGFAPAYAGMAFVYTAGSGWMETWPPLDGMPKAKAMAQKAIDLDPTIAEAWAALGQAKLNFDWDWAGAERDLKKAFDLDPNSALVLDAYSGALAIFGRSDEAVAVLRRALDLDPLSPGLHHDMAFPYWLTGRFDLAIPHLRRAVELDRSFHPSRQLLAFSYQLAGRPAEAAAEFETLGQLAPDLPWVQGSLGYFYGVSGRPAEARKVLATLHRMAATRYVPRWARAITYVGLGDRNRALDELEKGCDEHDGWMWTLGGDPWYITLRDEPRFQALVRRVQSGYGAPR